jgi:hypothetical protein
LCMQTTCRMETKIGCWKSIHREDCDSEFASISLSRFERNRYWHVSDAVDGRKKRRDSLMKQGKDGLFF